ncbi:MAG: 4-alpha-methyl-delta7-sterol-4alpha-methyl oxidase [Crocinitomicaceae bacterium]|jgi:4-alpha-methyl-delta7-sterol-4alpha-methyl oxidase
MSSETMALVTLGILIGSNVFAFIYSYFVLKTGVFKRFRIQSKAYEKGILKKRFPLYLLNLALLAAMSFSSVYAFGFLFDTGWPGIGWFVFQVIFVFLVDDFWFYIVHRYMHKNKRVLKQIHSIHHRATTPFPLEYLYVHPLEWMVTILGAFVAYSIILIFMPLNIYAFWTFGLFRNLHEIHIHSDLKIPILKDIPLISAVEDHDLHHAKLDGNYSSTFKIWDRIMGTTFNEKKHS